MVNGLRTAARHVIGSGIVAYCLLVVDLSANTVGLIGNEILCVSKRVAEVVT